MPRAANERAALTLLADVLTGGLRALVAASPSRRPRHGRRRAAVWGCAMFAAVLVLAGVPAQAQVTVDMDKAALQDIYNNTDGANWTHSTNWTSNKPLGEWYGVTTNAAGRVIGLLLNENNVRGAIPSSVGNLPHLTHLDLSRNALSGAIPSRLANLSRLTHLALWGNALTGAIPPGLGSLSHLEHLDLAQNMFSGAITSALGNLSNLTYLALWGNAFSGTIPPALGDLSNLTHLYLSQNKLTGAIPSRLGNLSNLTHLDLSQNGFTGAIPPGLATLYYLMHLDLSQNKLTGAIPSWLGNLPYLTYLDLSQNQQLTGTVPILSPPPTTGPPTTAPPTTGPPTTAPPTTGPPAPGERLTLDVTHFTNGAGWSTELVLVNLKNQPARPDLYFSDTGGALIAADSVVDVTGNLERRADGGLTVQTALEPLEELTISTHGRGALVTGSVRVLSGNPLGGLVRWSVPDTGQQAAVGASPPVGAVTFPVRHQQGGLRTSMALHNPGAASLEVRCRLMSVNGGAALEEVGIPLAAAGHTFRSLDAAFPTTDTSDFAGTVHCTAPGLFTAIAMEREADTGIFTTLPLLPGSLGTGGATTLDFAHFANGGAWSTDLVFVNLATQASGASIRPEIFFYGPTGQLLAPASVVDITGNLEVSGAGGLTVQTALAPLEVLTISTHGGGALVTGSVKVVSAGPLGGMLRFGHPGFGEAVVGANADRSTAIFPVRRQEGGITTGVAIHNRESSQELVRCELRQEGVLLDSKTFSLEANGQTSWLFNAVFTAAETSDFAGMVQCEAVGNGVFTAVGLEMDPRTRTFIALPEMSVPAMPASE